MPYKDKQKKRDYQLRWWTARKALFFDGKVCVDCGTTKNLELDHVFPELKVSHRIWSWSWKRLFEEASKCVPRCRRCHKKRSSEQRRRPIVHGTDDGYRHHGCRCAACTEIHKEVCRNWKRLTNYRGCNSKAL